MLRALARVDLGAIERNCARLARAVAPATLCAVVKADGYGHGAVWAARAALAGGDGAGVHVKLDTGMGRLGTRDADEAARVAGAVAAAPGLRLAGAMTHFATADDDTAFAREQ